MLLKATLTGQDLPNVEPPPFFHDNEIHTFGMCSVGEHFAPNVIVPHPGWDWVNEGQKGQLSKWGFVSTQVIQWRCIMNRDKGSSSRPMKAMWAMRPMRPMTPMRPMKAMRAMRPMWAMWADD
jgi:hypothetical protein